MTTITVYQTDDNNVLLFAVEAHALAMQPGSYNVPFRAVKKKPPSIPEGQRARWISQADATDPAFLVGTWKLEDISTPDPAITTATAE